MMQLDALVLYSNDGAIRNIHFRAGELNIITGESKTGKSSVIGILNYLLGSSSPQAPIGPIRETVAWYGLLAHVDSTSFFIGRPAPQGQTSSEAMIMVGVHEPPDFSALKVNTNTLDLVDFLGELEGIEENLFVPKDGQTRHELAANFKHSRYYCFQGQGEIANPDILFHHQNLDFQKQAIKDTLAYFLGAQAPDALLKRQRLGEIRRQRRELQNRLEEARSHNQLAAMSASSLLAESLNCGLIAKDVAPTDLPGMTSTLRAILESEIPNRPIEQTDTSAEASLLLNKRANLREQISEIDDELRGLEDYARSSTDYDTELEEHRVRLASIGLMPEPLDHSAPCPVCMRKLSGEASMQMIQNALGAISSAIQYSRNRQPQIAEAQLKLETRRNELRLEAQTVNRAIASLAQTDAIHAKNLHSWDQQSFIRGKIAQFLETIRFADSNYIVELEKKLTRLDSEARLLTEELDPDELRSAVISILQIVGQTMTTMAREIGLEHSDIGVWIDPSRLTVAVNTPNGPAFLDKGAIGSGMNWVGYHLVTYLALQSFFISHNRPVPSFIVIDQPSQAFFPQDRLEGGELDELSDTDRENTLKLYRLMYDTGASLKGKLQIIVLDHANFDVPWFRDSVIETWRGGNALIPITWIN